MTGQAWCGWYWYQRLCISMYGHLLWYKRGCVVIRGPSQVFHWWIIISMLSMNRMFSMSALRNPFIFVAYSVLNAYCIILMLYIWGLVVYFIANAQMYIAPDYEVGISLYLQHLTETHPLFRDHVLNCKMIKHNFITVMHCIFGVYGLRNAVVLRLLITLTIMLSTVSDTTPWRNIKQCQNCICSSILNLKNVFQHIPCLPIVLVLEIYCYLTIRLEMIQFYIKYRSSHA